MAAMYHALRLKAVEKGQSALTADGVLAAGSFTWDDLRDRRHLIPDLDSLPLLPTGADASYEMEPHEDSPRASSQARGATSSSSSSSSGTSGDEEQKEKRTAVAGIECFLQNTKVHFTHHSNDEGQRIPWCRRRGKPYGSEPQATGLGLDIAEALGPLCSGCMTAVVLDSRRG